MRLKDLGKRGFVNPTFLLINRADHLTLKLLIKHLEKNFGIKPQMLSFKSSTIDEIIDIIHAGSLFASHNLFIIDDLESIKKSQMNDLTPHFSNLLAENAVFVLIKNKTRISDKLLKTGKLVRLALDIEEDVVTWIRAYFKRAGLEITRKSIDLLIDWYHDNLESLEAELEKIRHYFHDEKIVDTNKLTLILSDSPVVNAIKFSEATIKKNKKAALCQIGKMREWDLNLHMVIGTMTGYLIRKLEKSYADVSIFEDLRRLVELDVITKSRTQLPWYHLELYTINN
ncbi:MAG TPA: hypothetical protein EYP58_01145 [bacterium (Candidatus Stahlbacteria)]|nr:hypothetical protein [Candidatus Stahlbacteria bacterium]